MENDLISIIVPVYNVKDYLERCLSSILNQSYKNIEIILIDDGSTDKSSDICDIFSKNDSRIRVIHTNNNGVSYARNLGIESINGKYFIFIDSDDYIKPEMIENLYNNIIKFDCDISICNVVKVDKNGKIIELPIMDNKKRILSQKEFASLLYNNKMVHGYPINKLIKTKCTENIRFDTNIYHLEDWDYLCRLSKNINKAIYDSSNYYYYYVDRNNSAVHSTFNEAWTTDLIARKKNIKLVDLYSDYDRDRFYFDYVINSLNTYGLHFFSKKLTKVERRELIYIAKKYYPTIIKSASLTKNEKIKLKIKYKIPLIYFGLMLIFK